MGLTSSCLSIALDSWQAICTHTHLYPGFPHSCLQKIPGLFQDPKTSYQDSVIAQKCLITNSSYLIYNLHSVTEQSIAKRSSQVAKKLFG